MNVIDIVRQWLEEHQCDGLVSDEGECGCELADLVPCQDCFCGCSPAYRGANPSRESDWLMYRSRAVAADADEAVERARLLKE